MVPHLLRLRNFMSYGDEPAELNFEGIHLACLSGGNGNGKSALLDAMTWALWGRSRAKREDDLVYHGATEMEVEFEFSVGHGRYRVLRKRTLRRSGGMTALELQALGEGGFTSLTGGTMAETQARILDILKLGYETFINSTFLLQGRADEFTVKPPAQRKAVLGEILGLAEYERLAERARQRSRDLAASAAARREAISDDEQELVRRPALREELAALEGAREAAIIAVRAAEHELWSIRAEQQRLESEQRTLDGVLRAIAGLREEIQTLAGRRDEALRVVRDAEALLADAETITRRADELRAVRAELDEMGARAATAMHLEKECWTIRDEINRAEEAVRHTEKTAAREAEKYARDAAAIPALQRQVAELEAVEARIPVAETEREGLAREIEGLRCTIVSLQRENAALEAQKEPLRERLRLLKEKGAVCPVCNKPMDEAERQHLYEDFKTQGLAKNEQIKENTARIGTAEEQMARLQARDRELAATLSGLQRQVRELDTARHRLAAAAEAATAEQEARRRAGEARRALESGAVAREARARLAALEQKVRDTGYDKERHDALKARARELASADNQMAQLATARERHAHATEIIAAAENDLARRQRDLETEQARVEHLRELLSVLPGIEARLHACEETLAQKRRDDELLHNRISALRERLRGLDTLEDSLRVRRAELAAMEHESDAYAELGRIFGKSGIQAMIIDNALPELERGTNALLARMSDSGMQVQFLTQAQGVKKDVLETLDIRIADANGTRPYEMFSGGEAFRVNFAIRIALSRLLAERAGARLQMLVIDEGFGTQDNQGRERLVEAITSIADDFDKIIVITHIDELKDMFSTRIDVVKETSGSRISVTAA